MKKLIFLIMLIGIALPVYAENVCMFSDGTTTMLSCDSNRALEVTTTSSSGLASEHAEDVAHSSGDIGSFPLGVRQSGSASHTTLSSANGDYTPMAVNQYGSLFCDLSWRGQISSKYTPIKLEDAAHGSADALMGVAGVMDIDGGFQGANGDYVAPIFDNDGALWVQQTANVKKVYHGSGSDTISFAAINVDGADSDEIIAAVTGDKLRVFSYNIKCSGAVNITFEEGGGTDLTGAIPLTANGDLGAPMNCGQFGCFETSAGEALNLLKSAAVNCDGHITYAAVD